MMLQSGGGGGGRDVIFRLRAEYDNASSSAFKKMVDEMTKAQKSLVEAGTRAIAQTAAAQEKAAKKNAADITRENAKETAEAFKRDKLIADNYLKTHLKALDDRKRAEKEFADWRQRLVHNSAVLEQKENIRLAREGAKARADAEREGMRQSQMASLAAARRSAGWGQLAGGVGNVARGVAYSGLIGERNTQTVLNTMLAVEAGGSIARGASAAVRGASAATGMAIGAGGATAGAGAAIAALVAWLPALASAVRGAAVAIRGSEITKRGDLGGGIGEGIAGTYAGMAGMIPKWARGAIKNQFAISQGMTGVAPSLLGGYGIDPYFDAADSSSALSGSQGATATRQNAMATQAGLLGDMGQMKRDASKGNLGAAQGNLRGDVARLNDLSAGGQSNAATQAAYQNVRASMEQVRQLSLDAARAQVDGSRAQLANLQQSVSEAKQIADQSRRAYEGDTLKAATASPEEVVRIREIDRKRKAGQTLHRNEIEFASGFSEFQDLAKSEAEKRAQANGLGDVFAGGRQRAKDDALREAELTKEAVKLALEVTQKTEVVVRLEGEGFAEEILKGIDETLPAKLKAIEEKMMLNMENRIKQAQVQFANARNAG